MESVGFVPSADCPLVRNSSPRRNCPYYDETHEPRLSNYQMPGRIGYPKW